MQVDEVSQQITDFFSTQLGVEVPSTDADLFEQGLIDSLGLVDLLFYLESNLGAQISLEEADFDDFRTIERIAQLVVHDSAGKNSNVTHLAAVS